MREVVFNGWGQWFDTDIYGSITYELGSDYDFVGTLAMSCDDEIRYDNGFITYKQLTRLYPCPDSDPKCHFQQLKARFRNGECSDYAGFNSECEYSLPITQADSPTFLINNDKEFHINIKPRLENPSEIPVKETKPINQNSNSLDFSGLLNNPLKKDDWFCVIDDMTRAFHAEFDKIPNEPQAWGALWTTPPEGYKITTGEVEGDDFLFMPGTKPLSKSSFTKRWSNYTDRK